VEYPTCCPTVKCGGDVPSTPSGYQPSGYTPATSTCSPGEKKANCSAVCECFPDGVSWGCILAVCDYIELKDLKKGCQVVEPEVVEYPTCCPTVKCEGDVPSTPTGYQPSGYTPDVPSPPTGYQPASPSGYTPDVIPPPPPSVTGYQPSQPSGYTPDVPSTPTGYQPSAVDNCNKHLPQDSASYPFPQLPNPFEQVGKVNCGTDVSTCTVCVADTLSVGVFTIKTDCIPTETHVSWKGEGQPWINGDINKNTGEYTGTLTKQASTDFGWLKYEFCVNNQYGSWVVYF